MDEKQERHLRHKAMRLLLRGLSPARILQQIPRSRAWFYKWRQRFHEERWVGLRSQGRQPQRASHQYPVWVRRLVIQTRRRLQRRKVGLIGAKAIQRDLRQSRLLRYLPSKATIHRILHQERLLKTPSPPGEVYFPQPTATPRFVLQALDWTARYLEGGPKVFAFHSLDLDSRACTQTISTDKSGATVQQHMLEVWRHLGIPDGLQMDNDAAFCGGYKAPRLIGQLVRLCLYVGIEPIFLPVGEPERNGDVERLHGLWQEAFWNRRRFCSVAQVRRASPQFEHWYAHSYEPPTLQGQTPAQAHRQRTRRRLTTRQRQVLPEKLPITAGRIHFIRQVDAQGAISLLNETWPVSRRLAGQYVWATLTTHENQLKIYHRRSAEAGVRQIKIYRYTLEETVISLLPDFKRPYRRRKMSTML